jgi:hypothetical protein
VSGLVGGANELDVCCVRTGFVFLVSSFV